MQNYNIVVSYLDKVDVYTRGTYLVKIQLLENERVIEQRIIAVEII